MRIKQYHYRLSEAEKAKHAETECNVIDVYITYELGGYSYFHSENQGRGYYIHFKPKTVTADMEQCVLLGSGWESGFKVMLQPAERRTKKMTEKMERMFTDEIGHELGRIYTNGSSDDVLAEVKRALT